MLYISFKEAVNCLCDSTNLRNRSDGFKIAEIILKEEVYKGNLTASINLADLSDDLPNNFYRINQDSSSLNVFCFDELEATNSTSRFTLVEKQIWLESLKQKRPITIDEFSLRNKLNLSSKKTQSLHCKASISNSGTLKIKDGQVLVEGLLNQTIIFDSEYSQVFLLGRAPRERFEGWCGNKENPRAEFLLESIKELDSLPEDFDSELVYVILLCEVKKSHPRSVTLKDCRELKKLSPVIFLKKEKLQECINSINKENELIERAVNKYKDDHNRDSLYELLGMSLDELLEKLSVIKATPPEEALELIVDLQEKLKNVEVRKVNRAGEEHFKRLSGVLLSILLKTDVWVDIYNANPVLEDDRNKKRKTDRTEIPLEEITALQLQKRLFTSQENLKKFIDRANIPDLSGRTLEKPMVGSKEEFNQKLDELFRDPNKKVDSDLEEYLERLKFKLKSQ